MKVRDLIAAAPAAASTQPESFSGDAAATAGGSRILNRDTTTGKFVSPLVQKVNIDDPLPTSSQPGILSGIGPGIRRVGPSGSPPITVIR